MNENIREFIYSQIGQKYFATRAEDGIPAMAQNMRRVITLYVLRETIAPLIDRSDDPESSVSFVMTLESGVEAEIIEIPARKFKSKEKLMGLKLCRSFKAVDTRYEYNSVRSIGYLANPNSVIFGDSVVEGGDSGQAMLPSRVLYSSSYSIRSKPEITKQLTHNSLSEQGTMWDREKGENRTSLFSTEYVIPGAFFPSFITLINPTPESLIHILLCLKERSYGAQTSITGPNVMNHVVGIYCGEEELPITSYTVSRDSRSVFKWDQDPVKFKNSLNNFVLEAMGKELTGKLVYGRTLEDFTKKIDNFDVSDLQLIYDQLKSDSQDLVKYAKILPKEKKTRGVGSKQKDLESNEEENEGI
ncbi:MAG: type I-D CRISPR-associated protein Cas7/Csc2 [Thermoplasmatales archaeon]